MATNRQAVTSELKDRKWSPISPIQTAVCNVDRQTPRCLAEEGGNEDPDGGEDAVCPRHVLKDEPEKVRRGRAG